MNTTEREGEQPRNEARGRKPREEQETRRRKSRDGVIGRRLGVSESMLDFNAFAYRWVNDSPSRIFNKTEEDDWNIVHQTDGEIKGEADLGSAVSQIVGTNPDGSPMRAYLCRKRLEWYNADQDEKKRELQDQLAELRRGNDRNGAPQSDYVPNAGIRL